MNEQKLSNSNFWVDNQQSIIFYISLISVGILSIIGFLLFEGKEFIAIAFVGGLVSVWLVTQPKIAFYQFVTVMFTNLLFIDRPVILIVDISAFLVIVTAIFDILLKGEYKFTLPKLSFNFFVITILFCLVALFSYNQSLAVLPILHIVYLFATFLSLYRLSRYVTIEKTLKLFFILSVANALVAVLPYIGASKVERLFGLAHSTLDDILMIAFPIGIVYFIKSSEKTFYYLISLLIIIGGLIATQSRLSILFALFFGGVAVLYSIKIGEVSTTKLLKRVQGVAYSLLLFIVLILFVAPEYLTALLERFGSLLNSAPSETFLVRIVLWTNALTTFADNIFFGIGLGHYKILYTIYSSIHLHYMFPYIQGYSAHNMFFHYLAETGLVGTTAVFALIINQFRIVLKTYKSKKHNLSDIDICLLVVSLLFLVTSFIEAGWMWGQMGYLFVFFLVLIVRNFEKTVPAS